MAASTIFTEYVVANSLSFGGRAAWIESYSPLDDDPPIVGENVHIPGYGGREPYAKEPDELHVTLVVNVDGDYNFDNDNVSASPKAQLRANRDKLRDRLGPSWLEIGDGTVAMAWHQDGGDVVTVDVQSLGFTGWTSITPTFRRTTWDLIVPAGAFEGIGS
jgi:hypothetical protein